MVMNSLLESCRDLMNTSDQFIVQLGAGEVKDFHSDFNLKNLSVIIIWKIIKTLYFTLLFKIGF